MTIPQRLDCPRAKTWMTPCVARDGRTACSDRDPDQGMRAESVVCVGCGQQPRALLLDLSQRYKPARRYRQTHDPENCADILTRMVAEYVEAPDGERP